MSMYMAGGTLGSVLRECIANSKHLMALWSAGVPADIALHICSGSYSVFRL